MYMHCTLRLTSYIRHFQAESNDFSLLLTVGEMRDLISKPLQNHSNEPAEVNSARPAWAHGIDHGHEHDNLYMDAALGAYAALGAHVTLGDMHGPISSSQQTHCSR